MDRLHVDLKLVKERRKCVMASKALVMSHADIISKAKRDRLVERMAEKALATLVSDVAENPAVRDVVFIFTVYGRRVERDFELGELSIDGLNRIKSIFKDGGFSTSAISLKQAVKLADGDTVDVWVVSPDFSLTFGDADGNGDYLGSGRCLRVKNTWSS